MVCIPNLLGKCVQVIKFSFKNLNETFVASIYSVIEPTVETFFEFHSRFFRLGNLLAFCLKSKYGHRKRVENSGDISQYKPFHSSRLKHFDSF